MPRELLDSLRIFNGAVFAVDRDRLLEESGIEIVREELNKK